jgi:predicted transcriptional regulator
MATVLVSMRIESAIKERLDSLAETVGQSRNALFGVAIARYLDEQEAALSDLQEGLDDLDAGRVVPHDDVVRQLIAQGYMTQAGYEDALSALEREATSQSVK